VLSLVSQPVNIGKAYVAGVELAAQTTFSFLPAPFDKLGVSGNITLLDSDAPVNGVRAPIAGLSKANANATLYYETAKWGVRGSINHRSSYLRTVYDGKDPTTMDGFDGTDYIDAAAFYNITKGVRLSIDAINIGNEREVQFNSTYHRLHNETQSGTTVFFGLGVKF
jgi:iron complex outermembrane receptor protein